MWIINHDAVVSVYVVYTMSYNHMAPGKISRILAACFNFEYFYDIGLYIHSFGSLALMHSWVYIHDQMNTFNNQWGL